MAIRNYYYFEVLWYDNDGNARFVSFKSMASALNFYEQHKDDDDKHDFWVTKRDGDGHVVLDIII